MKEKIDKLNAKLKSGFTFFEGGCGTILQAAGLAPGELPEEWNISHPEVIQKMHSDYIKAGADILKSNTFGANYLKFLKEDEAEGRKVIGTHRLNEVINAAFDNARAAIKNSGRDDVFLSLDIGPLGHLLKPLGDLSFDEAYDVYKETVRVGCEAGADLILVETMTDIDYGF